MTPRIKPGLSVYGQIIHFKIIVRLVSQTRRFLELKNILHFSKEIAFSVSKQDVNKTYLKGNEKAEITSTTGPSSVFVHMLVCSLSTQTLKHKYQCNGESRLAHTYIFPGMFL